MSFCQWAVNETDPARMVAAPHGRGGGRGAPDMGLAAGVGLAVLVRIVWECLASAQAERPHKHDDEGAKFRRRKRGRVAACSCSGVAPVACGDAKAGKEIQGG